MRIRRCLVTLAVPILVATAGSAAQPVARIGSRVLDEKVLARAVAEGLNARYYHGALTPEKELRIRREELGRLVRRTLDVLGALDRGLPLPLEEAGARRADIEKQLGKRAYDESIAALGWSRRDHVAAIADSLLADRAYRKFVLEPAEVAEDDVKRLYSERAATLVIPESRHLEHILLRVPPTAAEGDWLAREVEAGQLMERLRAGASFAEIAEARSDSPHRVKGGDLGWVHRGRLEEPVEFAAWAVPVGALVGPLRGDDGIHILHVFDCRDPRPLTYTEAAPKLRRDLEETRRKASEERWYTEIRVRHPVEVLDARLRDTVP